MGTVIFDDSLAAAVIYASWCTLEQIERGPVLQRHNFRFNLQRGNLLEKPISSRMVIYAPAEQIEDLRAHAKHLVKVYGGSYQMGTPYGSFGQVWPEGTPRPENREERH